MSTFFHYQSQRFVRVLDFYFYRQFRDPIVTSESGQENINSNGILLFIASISINDSANLIVSYILFYFHSKEEEIAVSTNVLRKIIIYQCSSTMIFQTTIYFSFTFHFKIIFSQIYKNSFI